MGIEEKKMNSLQELKDLYKKYWEEETELFIMPYTIRARAYLQKVHSDISFSGILDNDDKQDGKTFCDVPIIAAKKMLCATEKKKILISAHYREISEQLNALGYQEYIDYIDMHAYISLWYWDKKKEVHLLDVHTAITTHCSLNCANCNMFLNYYKPELRSYISLEAFQENYDALFQVVDYCYKITILGGEPLLNKKLPKMLYWLKEAYGEKIGEIDIVTNGTLIPSKELMEAVKATQAIILVSDYSLNAKYAEKIEKLERALIEHEISYQINHEMKWKDFYFPRTHQGADFTSFREHMLCCNPVFRGLNDKKFYYCHIIWSAQQAGLWYPQEGDYLELGKLKCFEDKEKILAYDLGFMEKGYVTLCRACGGCGVDNKSIIDAGIQE